MNFWKWITINTPDGATYLQVILILTLIAFSTKLFLIPMVKDIREIWKELSEEDEV